MEDDDAWVNPTLAMLAEMAGSEQVERLRGRLERQLDGHSIETILAAVVPLLVEIHLDAHSDDDNRVCVPCANADLTDLLQAMRRISEDTLDGSDIGEDHEQ